MKLSVYLEPELHPMPTASIKSIRPFLGSKDYAVSRKFYRTLGFAESEIGDNMCFFHREGFGFYLQDAYVKNWIDNTMVFLEVDDLDGWWTMVNNLNLPGQFPGVRVKEIVDLDWGREFFVHDPAGNLWHIGSFKY